MPGCRPATRPRARLSRQSLRLPAITSRSWWSRRSSRMAKAAKKKKAKAPVRRAGKAKPAKARRSAEQMLGDLKARLREIADLYSAEAVLSWDQATYMPPGGAGARGRQSALLSRLAHERRIDPEIGRLLDGLASFAESLPPDHDDACL